MNSGEMFLFLTIFMLVALLVALVAEIDDNDEGNFS